MIGYTTSKDGTAIAWAETGEGPPLLRGGHWLSHLEHDWKSPVYAPLLERLAQKHVVSVALTKTYDSTFVERYRAAGVHVVERARFRDYDVLLANTLLSSSSLMSGSRRIPTVWWIHEPSQ